MIHVTVADAVLVRQCLARGMVLEWALSIDCGTVVWRVCGGAAGGGVTFEPGIPWWVPKCYSQWWTRDLLDLKVCLACPPERGLVIYKPVFFWPLQFLCNLSQISGESVYSLYPSLFLGFTLYSVCASNAWVCPKAVTEVRPKFFRQVSIVSL